MQTREHRDGGPGDSAWSQPCSSSLRIQLLHAFLFSNFKGQWEDVKFCTFGGCMLVQEEQLRNEKQC